VSDFKFNCPHCEQPLEAPEDMLGQTIECPSCNGSLELPKPDPQPEPDPPVELRTPVESPPPPLPQKQTKDCPFCGEEILVSARKCKHCGEFLDGSHPQAPDRNRKSSDDPEATLWSAHTSMLYYIPMIIFGIILIPFIIGIFIILYAVLDQRCRVFTLTNRRVMSKWGIISRKTREVAIRDIRNINMSQGILERIFGLGSIEIGSAGTAGIEVKFTGVAKPTSVRDLVRKTKDEWN